MERALNWLISIFKEGLSKALVIFLSGVILTLIGFAAGGGLSRILVAEARAPLALIIILSLFSLLGIAVAVSKVVPLLGKTSAGSSPGHVSVQDIDLTVRPLLRELARIEAGVEIHGENKVRQVKAEVLTLVDEWEIVVSSLLSPYELELVTQIREQIRSGYLPQATDAAPAWVQEIKRLTREAKSVLVAAEQQEAG